MLHSDPTSRGPPCPEGPPEPYHECAVNIGIRPVAPRQPPSLLPPILRRLLALAIVLAGFMLADTLYLLLVRLAGRVGLDPFALGAESLRRLYQILLLVHIGAGLLLTATTRACPAIGAR